MPFVLCYTEEAAWQYRELQQSNNLVAQRKAVNKALRLLAMDPRHPGLQTHAYTSLNGPNGSKVYEAYAQQHTPGAYRIFWCYHPPKSNSITILAITPHP